MSQKGHLLAAEGTLVGVQLESCLSEVIENIPQVSEVNQPVNLIISIIRSWIIIVFMHDRISFWNFAGICTWIV